MKGLEIMRRKLVVLLLTAVFVLGLVASGCSKKGDGTESASGNSLDPELVRFYDHVNYKDYKNNVFAAISPVCGISLNFDVSKYEATSNEYTKGDESAIVKVGQKYKIGNVLIEYQPSVTRPESEEYKEEEVTINGMDAIMLTRNGAKIWDSIWFTGEYEGFIITNLGVAWLEEDYDEFMNILNDSLILIKYNK